MENKKQDFSITQSESNNSARVYPKSILRKLTDIKTERKLFPIKKSKTTNPGSKSVSFPDRIKQPIHVIIEVEPIIYEDQINEDKKSKKKSKGCNCVVI